MEIIMGIGKIVKLFKNHSVAVVGMKGCGKDMLTANVVVRRNIPYISNTDYGGKCERFPLVFSALDAGGNTYQNFLSQQINRYIFPYPRGTDVYIGDAGIYLPSQYCGELNRDFKTFPTFISLSRQLGNCRVHANCQNLNRIWDKLREHMDVYLYCRWCKVLFGKLVIQLVTEYDNAESCISRISPCRVKVPILGNKVAKMQALTYIDNFFNSHGIVRNHLLIYINRSKYDTNVFKSKLERGVDD